MDGGRAAWKYAAEQLPLVSRRQREILDLVLKGSSNQQIADHFGMTLAGAKWHVSELMGKLGLGSREELADFWAAQRARRRWPPSLRWRWGGAVAAAAAVGMALSWLLLGGTEERPGSEGRQAADPGLPPFFSRIDGSTVPLPAKGVEGRLAYFDPQGNLLVKPMPSGSPTVVRPAADQRTPRWSPSGDYLAVVERGALIVIDGTGALAKLADVDRDVTWGWSPAEDVLALYTGEGLVLYNARTATTRTLRGQGAPLPEQPGSLLWSPDGMQILYSFLGRYSTVGAKDISEMRVVEVRTGNDRLLVERQTPPESHTAPLGWSGDGEWVFYRDAGVYANSAWVDAVPVYVMPAAGGPATRLGSSLGGEARGLFSAVAPGGRVAYVEGGQRFAMAGRRRIEVFEGGRHSRLADAAPGLPSGLAWSPDGSQLAYVAMPDPVRTSGDGQEVLVQVSGQAALDAMLQQKLWVQVPGGAAARLTADPGFRDEHPLWSVDGKSIAFTRIDAAGKASVWRIAASGGPPELVVDALGLGERGPLGTYGWVDWESLLDWWR